MKENTQIEELENNKESAQEKRVITKMTLIKAFSVLAIIAFGGMLVANTLGIFKLNTPLVIISLTCLMGSLVFWVVNDAKAKNRQFKSLIPTFVVLLLFGFGYILYFTSPEAVLITTGRYGQGTEEENKKVDSILGEDYAKERFELYFQWYNILHEMGHGIIYFNGGSNLHSVDEEQLVNDFAVAFWAYYGEEQKFRDLEFMVAYALENFDRPVDESKTHIDYARKNWGGRDFFTFNNYGWFQFSCVSSSLRERKSLESVLSEMGVKNIHIQPQKTFVYPVIGEDSTTTIIKDAVAVLREWGAVIPDVYHTLDDDPNLHMMQIKRNVFGYLDTFYKSG